MERLTLLKALELQRAERDSLACLHSFELEKAVDSKDKSTAAMSFDEPSGGGSRRKGERRLSKDRTLAIRGGGKRKSSPFAHAFDKWSGEAGVKTAAEHIKKTQYGQTDVNKVLGYSSMSVPKWEAKRFLGHLGVPEEKHKDVMDNSYHDNGYGVPGNHGEKPALYGGYGKFSIHGMLQHLHNEGHIEHAPGDRILKHTG